MQQLEIADEDDDIGGSRPGQRFLSGGGPCRVHDMSALDVGRGYDPYDLWRDVVVDVVDVCIDEGGEETQICLHCLFGFTLSFLGFFLVSFFLSFFLSWSASYLRARVFRFLFCCLRYIIGLILHRCCGFFSIVSIAA